MAATYTFICIPLDSRDPSSALTEFKVNIVSHLVFDMGTTISSDVIHRAIVHHPILKSLTSMKAVVLDLRRWIEDRSNIDRGVAIPIDLIYSGDSVEGLMNRYLTPSSNTVAVAKIDHDPRYDRLSKDDFVEVVKAADDFRSVHNELRLSASKRLSATLRRNSGSQSVAFAMDTLSRGDPDWARNLSLPLARWFDSSAHAFILEAISEDNPDHAEHLFSAFGSRASHLRDLRSAVKKLQRRMTTEFARSLPHCDPQLSAIDSSGNPQPVSISDPNVAIHAALKNPLLADRCGFVTSWTARSSVQIPKGDYVIQLTDVFSDLYVRVEAPKPTVFRRASHTHPLSAADVGSGATGNCALAFLNDHTGAPRYRATSVNAETSLVKDAVVQSKNSLSRFSAEETCFGNFYAPVDNRPPDFLNSKQFGSSEPETSGITVSAPVEDLVLPSSLKGQSPDQRNPAWPCYFLEDLWIGYRMDLKRQGNAKFTSIHRQQQQLSLRSGGDTNGWMETYIDREQADDSSTGYSSTDLTTYTGLSEGQRKDYLLFLGVNDTTDVVAQQPFSVKVTQYDRTERLAFGNVYDYRLRSVFLGGVSCDPFDSELDRFSSEYIQTVPFYRSRTLRPGEVLYSDTNSPNTTDRDGHTIYLTPGRPQAAVCIVPSPIDLTSVRFHQMLFNDTKTLDRLKTRRVIADLSKAFKSLPPQQLDYFFDPDVFGIILRVTMLNGNPDSQPEGVTYKLGSYCNVVKHLHLDPISVLYGNEGKWEEFEPITITFERSNNSLPRISRLNDRSVEISIPPASEVQISLLPLFNPLLLAKTASFASSSAIFRETRSTNAAASVLPIPAIADQRLTIIHAVQQPSQLPILVAETARQTDRSANLNGTSIGLRELGSDFGSVVGRIEVDAPSTREIRLEVSWLDIVDDPRQEVYAFNSVSASASPRSVAFRKYDPVPPTASNFRDLFQTNQDGGPSMALLNFQADSTRNSFPDQFELQCLENKVFMGRPGETGCSGVSDTFGRINLKDQRRKLAQAQAVAVSRFAAVFGGDTEETELRSEPTTVDFPSVTAMTAPQVSCIVPLRRAVKTVSEGASRQMVDFAFRIHVSRPFFESGVGERLAIACAAGTEPVNAVQTVKYLSHWGEDPLERAGLKSSMRNPHASDFGTIDEPNGTENVDARLYPPFVTGGDSAVIYRDNVPITPSAAGGEQKFVSIASYAVRYDGAKRLWYADVRVVSDFFGWCGLALYRHQPHASPVQELSQTFEWVYAAVLYGEPIAWVERSGRLYVTIGPIYDSNVTFDLDSLSYEDGVSEGIADSPRIRQPLSRYQVGNAFYFEGQVRQERFKWSWIKKRFGFDVGSGELN